MKRHPLLGLALAAVATFSVVAQTPAPQAQTPAAPQQPTDVALVISGDPGSPPHYAVPDLIAATPEAAAAAKEIGPVLFADLQFEREFDMIPRDIVATIPAARSPEQIPFDAWREVNADAVVFGSVQKSGTRVTVQVRLYNVRTRQAVFSSEYTGDDRNPRLYAHTIADEIHKQQRGLRGVARTRLAFMSDRNRERVNGTVIENREAKELFIADYDGANQRRLTVSRDLQTSPSWSPDGRAIAYTSWRKVPTGGAPDIYISRIYQGLLENPTKGRVESNMQPMFSPDGTKIAFWSNRDGNPEVYVMNVDGSGVRRLTNHPAADVMPIWSPTGAQLAFTSDRAGQPQIFVMNADGSNPRRLTVNESYADRATWSPAPFNEIAYSARTGGGYDIHVYDLATGQTRSLTFGEGSNESPVYSPNGRHLAFTSTRNGRTQVFTMTRDGRDVKQITRDGNNYTPAWSN